MTDQLTFLERKQIAQILSRRANEIAEFKKTYCDNPVHLDSVELALTLEIGRLRRLESLIDSDEPV